MPYLVKLEKFEGPLDLLLSLIEQEELSITDISLAKVTDGYLTILRSAKKIQPEELADFLVIAAKLILIKSRILLPGLEAEEEGPSLEAQLKLYKDFVEASRVIDGMLKKKRFMFGRAKPFIEQVPEFSPPPKITASTLQAAFMNVIKALEPIFNLPRAAVERAISIQEKIGHLRTMILDRVAVRFGEILKGTKSRTEAIVSFLALLELVKQRVVEVKQDALFHDITLHKYPDARS